MKVNGLNIESCEKGRTVVNVWAKCYTVEDCEDLIAWLHMAKFTMTKWEKINAEASRSSKTATGQDEATKPGQVQGEPQSSEWPDGEYSQQGKFIGPVG